MRNRTCSTDSFPDHSCELGHRSQRGGQLPIAAKRRAIAQWREEQSHQTRLLVFIQGSVLKMRSHTKRQ